MDKCKQEDAGSIAIIGMALRVPGALNIEQFWNNLKNGIESTTFLDDDILRAAGVPEKDISDPNYVKAFGSLEGADLFDPAFFDLTPREAEILDPQHRQLLECSWEALEHAGYAPGSQAMKVAGRVGIFGGVGLNSYLLNQLMNRQDLIEALGGWQINLGNDKDFAATRVAYKFDLRGPAINVSTACSTSLVAVSMGCQSLLSYECDIILAGGCSLYLPQDQGYHYHSGGTLSPDGKCRAFDANAEGTFDANGTAVLILKRLEDAQRDGDTIQATILGAAINNDGADKVSYSAPSVSGQAAVIREAQAVAVVDASSIGYVETHGTGTDLGDLVEVAALTEAFSHGSKGKGWCGIGSLKTNLGHLDTAAGAASLIKTALGLRHGLIPPSLNFKTPNPKLGIENSPFYVNHTLSEWPRLDNAPRRAGVSSFGIGGTNAHLVVEEAPPTRATTESRPWQILPLSARGSLALEEGKKRLAKHFSNTPEGSLADMAWSLQTGRPAFSKRLAVIARDQNTVANALESENGSCFVGDATEPPTIVFVFPGQDSQFLGMAEGLYQDEPLFRAEVESCAAYLRDRHEIDLLLRMFPKNGDACPSYLIDPLPLLVLEHSLAKVWLALGVTPNAMLGYSLGEYTCACLAGVMTRDEALDLAVAGSSLFSLMKPGVLLAVTLSEEQLRPWLSPGLEISMIMAPHQCVVGGEEHAIETLERLLNEQKITTLRSQLTAAFHTSHVDNFLAPYRIAVKKIKLLQPLIPYISCVSGTWITSEEAMDPDHYLDLARGVVRLLEGVQSIFEMSESDKNLVMLEVGPSQTITGSVSLHRNRPSGVIPLATRYDPRFNPADTVASALPSAMARLWVSGMDLNWSALYMSETRRRVPLPTYAFEHARYWIDAAPRQPLLHGLYEETVVEKWFYKPVWYELPSLIPLHVESNWLVVGGGALGAELSTIFKTLGIRARYVAETPTDWGLLLDEMIAASEQPSHIVYLGLMDVAADDDAQLSSGFYEVLSLGRAIGRRWFSDALSIDVVARGLCSLDSTPYPAAAAVIGPLRVLPQEYPNLNCRAIDITVPAETWKRQRLIKALAVEVVSGKERFVALRGESRWTERFVSCEHSVPLEGTKVSLRASGVYLITGGLGNIGLALARHISTHAPGAKIVLTSRSGLPVDSTADTPLQSTRRNACLDIEASGAVLHIAVVDVADSIGMAALVDETEKRWDSINGVIHAAGLVGQESFATVAESTATFCERQFLPKLSGARVLEQVMGERPLDFCLLCSSLSPLLGGLGFAAYAAANAALDAIAAAHNLTHPVRWLTVNWEGWMFENEVSKNAAVSIEEMALSPQNGLTIFDRILAWPELSRIVLSKGNMDLRIQQWVSMDAKPLKKIVARHARPEMLGKHVPVVGKTQGIIVEIWESLLGIEGIGADDSFFELGGNSLLLTQLLAQIRKHFRAELSLTALFERPTVCDIAELVDAVRATVTDDPLREEGEL